MHLLKQSTAASVLVGPVLDSAGAAITAAVIGDFNITKNGTTAAMAAAATATHDHNGNYIIALTTGNTDTLGRLVISYNGTAHAGQMGNCRFEVLTAATFDAIVTNAAGAASGLLIAGSNAATTFATLTSTGAVSFGSTFEVTGTTTLTGAVSATAGITANITGNLVGTVSTLTTYTGNTPQTGDAYARIGATGSGLTSLAPAATALSSGTGANQISLSSGLVTLAAVTHTGAIIPTVTTTTTATNLTNLPSIPGNWITASGITASALDGKGDWLTDKAGYSLASTGLDAVATTVPTNASLPFNFRQMMIMLYRNIFGGATSAKIVKDATAGTIKHYADDGTTVITTQTWTDDGSGNEELNAST